MNNAVLRPTWGSRIKVSLGYSRSIHVSALYVNEDERQLRTLQCWTNLPVLGSGIQAEWQAYDLSTIDESGQVILQCRELVLDGTRLMEGRQYGLTWRTVNHSNTDVCWLGQSSQNVVFSFHLSRRPSFENYDDYHVRTLDCGHQNGRIPLDLQDSSKWLVLERTKATWHTARQFESLTAVSEEFSASLILAWNKNECEADRLSVCVLYPFADGHEGAGIARDGTDLHVVSSNCDKNREDRTSSTPLHVFVLDGASVDVHECIELAVKEAGREFNRPREFEQPNEPRRPSPLFESDTIGLCTWEALGNGKVSLTLKNVQQLLRAMPVQIPVDTLLIDDGWQHVSKANEDVGRRRLRSFDLQNDGTTSSNLRASLLQDYISKIREDCPSLKHIGVWLTMAGYWDGLSEDEHWQRCYGPLEKFQLEARMWPTSRPREWLLPCIDKLDAFYDDYFRALQMAGVSFVKVDDQADWEWIQPRDSLDVGDYIVRAWRALNRAAERNFGIGRVIHCMALGQRFLNSRMTLGNTTPLCVRNSDDTFPHVPDSHTWHVYHNAMQALLTSVVPGLVPDADMITTRMTGHANEDWVAYHLAFRCCFSSAKIWLSDSIDDIRECFGHLCTMLAPAKDELQINTLGELKTVQNRGRCTAVPLPSCIANIDLTGTSDGAGLKLASRIAVKSSYMTGILSVWNTRSRPAKVVDAIAVSDVYEAIFKSGTEIGRKEALARQSHFFVCDSRQERAAIVSIQECLNTPSSISRPLFAIHLPASGFEIYTACEMVRLDEARAPNIACIGLIDMTVGICAVECFETLGNQAIRAYLTRAGRCGFLVSADDLGVRWPATTFRCRIDNVSLSSSHLSHRRINQDNSLLLVIIDMVGHLRDQRHATATSHPWLWSVDLEVQGI